MPLPLLQPTDANRKPGEQDYRIWGMTRALEQSSAQDAVQTLARILDRRFREDTGTPAENDGADYPEEIIDAMRALDGVSEFLLSDPAFTDDPIEATT
jgi:hypothetical protein